MKVQDLKLQNNHQTSFVLPLKVSIHGRDAFSTSRPYACVHEQADLRFGGLELAAVVPQASRRSKPNTYCLLIADSDVVIKDRSQGFQGCDVLPDEAKRLSLVIGRLRMVALAFASVRHPATSDFALRDPHS